MERILAQHATKSRITLILDNARTRLQDDELTAMLALLRREVGTAPAELERASS